MMQTLLVKGRTLVLALIVVALLMPLNAGPAVAQAQFHPTVPSNVDVATGLPWYMTESPSKQLEDYNSNPFSSGNPWAPPDPIVPADRDIVDGLPWYMTESPSKQLEDSTGTAAAAPAAATAPEAELPETSGNSDALLFVAIAGALLVVGGLPTLGRRIVRKAGN